MKRRPLILLLIGLLAGCTSSPVARGPALTIGATQYIGTRSADDGVESFLGVPFAAPPVGELRWITARLFQPESGAVAASAFKPACMQGPHITKWYRGVIGSFGGEPSSFPEPEVSEDCLYLNVWRPRDRTEKLPIIVYVHGGSNRGGWSYEPNYRGDWLASRRVIVVSLAYRLGAFGFFAHPGLDDPNFALSDLVAGLQWVHAHAQALGGDSANITVMGESSGGNNIISLLASTRSRDLVNRVIVQSAGWAVNGRSNLEQQQALAVQLEERLLGDAGGMEALRRLPGKVVLTAAETVYAGHSFESAIDGALLQEPARTALAGLRFPQVDLLIGSNADEWRMYLGDDETLQSWGSENLRAPELLAVTDYFDGKELSRRTLDRVITAHEFVCPSMFLADQVQKNGGRSWYYFFSRQRPGELASTMGAYHGAELPYVFDTHDEWLPTAAIDRELGHLMMSYWANFARTGNPNGNSLPQWPRFDRAAGNVLQLDIPPGVIPHPSLGLCNLLEGTQGVAQ